MLSLPWIDADRYEHTECCWIPTVQGSRAKELPDVVLLSEDGFRFVAHSEILAQKSEKLAAAIRFASMSETTNIAALIEVNIAAKKNVCKWMIQHIYHGSVAFGMPSDPQELASDLLDLLVVAQEFICPTLIQECEMRLLASEARQCFCCSCAMQSVEDKLTYCVAGPSCCINCETALDVLSVAMSVSDSCQEMASYEIEVSWNDTPMSAWSSWTGATKLRPLDALREAVSRTILLNYSTVTSTECFDLYMKGEDSLVDLYDDKTATFLRLCLDEYLRAPGAWVRKSWQAHSSNPLVAAASCSSG